MNSKTEALTLVEKNIPKTAELFFKILSKIKKGTINVKTPSGDYLNFGGKEQGVNTDITIYDWKVCQNIILKGDIGLGESYIEGHWDSQNISNLIRIGVDNYSELESVIKGSILKILFYRIKHLLNKNTRKGSQRNIHAHYDLGNDFYKLWLDKTMTYSSALFNGQDIALEQAQQAKYQRIIDQLGVKPGGHILEIGCGWGGFMEHAAKQGIKVTGVTISKEQYDLAVNRLKPYSNLAMVELKDYRDIDGKYDHIVSIEMFEALGKEYWKTYFDKVHQLLKEFGNAMIQTITIRHKDFKAYSKGTDFIQQYIFPGGMLPSPELFKKVAKSSSLNVTDEIKFGTDYAKTLKKWEENFSSQITQVSNMGYKEEFTRTWKFYLKYCQGGFEAQKIGVSQFTISK